MRALLIATGYIEQMEILLQHIPTPLLRICDKPIIVHIIEALVGKDITQFDLVLYHMPEMVEKRLGRGERWGVNITYHIAKNPERPLETVKPSLKRWGDEVVLLGKGDCFPLFGEEQLGLEEENSAILYFFPNGDWSGWGLFSKSLLKEYHVETLPEGFIDERAIVEPFISARSYTDLQKSNFMAINSREESLFFPSTASHVEPGIWISRGVSIHPRAQIIPPVFIGVDSVIQDDVELGPNSVVEKDCIIDKGSIVRNSLLFRKSYVGEKLNIDQSLVDRNLLINIALDTNVMIKDDFILGELSPFPITWYVGNYIERFVALILIVFTFPFYFIVKACYSIEKTEMLGLPTTAYEGNWNTFAWYHISEYDRKKSSLFLRLTKNIPNLLNVVKGHVHFVGASPRTPKDVTRLPLDWRKLYVKSKVGLVTLSDLENPVNPTQDEIYTSEIYYAVRMSWMYDIKLLFQWVVKKLHNLYLRLKYEDRF